MFMVNAKYLLQKSMKHAPDSLEKAVENIVKSWEAEIQHKMMIPEQIDTIDQKEFSMATNNKTSGRLRISYAKEHIAAYLRAYLTLRWITSHLSKVTHSFRPSSRLGLRGKS